LPAGRLEEKPSQKQEAQQKHQSVDNDFDKTHDLLLFDKSLETPTSEEIV